MPIESQMPIISRGIIYGIATGIAFGVVRRLLYFTGLSFQEYLPIFIAYLIAVAIIAYKFVEHPRSGVFFGLATAVTQEILVAILLGGTPFYAFLNIDYLTRRIDVLLYYVISLIGFPLAGFLAGRYSQKRGFVKLPYSGSHELTELEKQVLSYIKTNNNRIHIVECALALNVEPALVEKAVESLQQKGEIQT